MAEGSAVAEFMDRNRSLVITDSQIYNFLEELASYLGGKLQQFDEERPNSHYMIRWDFMVAYAAEFVSDQAVFKELRARHQ